MEKFEMNSDLKENLLNKKTEIDNIQLITAESNYFYCDICFRNC